MNRKKTQIEREKLRTKLEGKFINNFQITFELIKTID